MARLTARARDRIGAIGRAAGLVPLPSATNFVALDCGGDGALARRVLDGLLARGVFVRMPGVAPLDRCIRVTAGPDAALDRLAAALPAAVAEARARRRDLSRPRAGIPWGGITTRRTPDATAPDPRRPLALAAPALAQDAMARHGPRHGHGGRDGRLHGAPWTR